MAAAQHRPQKPSMFRRILSPRDHKTKEKPRASTMSEVPSPVNGHRRDDQMLASYEVENTQYRDPEHLHQPYPPPPNRTQSLVYPSSSDSNAPNVPPRHARPVSYNSHPLERKQSNDADESALYVEPANTLKKDSAKASNYCQVEHAEAVPTKQDIKQMTMYKQTMEQKQGGGHRRVRSFGHVIDKSEYSTPFDLLEENERARQRGEEVLPPNIRATLNHPQRSVSDKPPPKPRRIRQTEAAADDSRIPVVSPTPATLSLSDRSHTNSPSSPHSTHSLEQEPIRDDGTNDYDEPWDNKFKDLPRVRTTNKSDSHSAEARASQRHTHSHHTESSHINDRGSPSSPVPFERPRRPNREREHVSISPELPSDRPLGLGFTKGGPARSSGRRDGSSSPLPPVRDGRSFSTPHQPLHHHSYHHSESGVRTSSVSMAGRLLPPTPSEMNERRILARDPSPPPVVIDVSIPLEDQP